MLGKIGIALSIVCATTTHAQAQPAADDAADRGQHPLFGDDLTSALTRDDYGATISTTSFSSGWETRGIELFWLRESPSDYTDPSLTSSPGGIRSMQLNNPLHRDDEGKLNYFWGQIGYDETDAHDALGPSAEYSVAQGSLTVGGQTWLGERVFAGGSASLTHQTYDYGSTSDSFNIDYFGLSAFVGFRDQLSWSRLTRFASEQVLVGGSIVNNFKIDGGAIANYPEYNYEYVTAGYSFFAPLCEPASQTSRGGCGFLAPERLRVSVSGTKEIGQVQAGWAVFSIGLNGALGASNVADTRLDSRATHYSLSVAYSTYEADDSETRYSGEDYRSLGSSQALFELIGFEQIFQREARIGVGYYTTQLESSGEAETWQLSLRFGGSRR